MKGETHRNGASAGQDLVTGAHEAGESTQVTRSGQSVGVVGGQETEERQLWRLRTHSPSGHLEVSVEHLGDGRAGQSEGVGAQDRSATHETSVSAAQRTAEGHSASDRARAPVEHCTSEAGMSAKSTALESEVHSPCVRAHVTLSGQVTRDGWHARTLGQRSGEGAHPPVCRHRYGRAGGHAWAEASGQLESLRRHEPSWQRTSPGNEHRGWAGQPAGYSPSRTQAAPAPPGHWMVPSGHEGASRQSATVARHEPSGQRVGAEVGQ